MLVIGLIIIIAGAAWIEGKIKENRYIGLGITDKNTINVTGEGKISVKPDLAVANVSVVSESKKVSDAQAVNTQKMNAITNYLKNDLKIEDKDLKTVEYNIYPDYNYTQEGGRIFIGYKITQTLEVKIRDLAKVGDVLEGVVAKGANEVSSLQFTVDDLEKVKIDARKLAIDNAKAKAEALTSQLGVKLGRIVSFSENYYNPYPGPYIMKEMSSGVGGGGVVPDIQAGENEITVNVSVVYEMN